MLDLTTSIKNQGKNFGNLRLSFKVEKLLLNKPNFSDTQATNMQLSAPNESSKVPKWPDKSNHKENSTTDAMSIRMNILSLWLQAYCVMKTDESKILKPRQLFKLI